MTDKHIRDMSSKEIGEHLFPHRKTPATPDMIPRAEAERMAQAREAAALRKAGEWHKHEAAQYSTTCGQKDGVDFYLVAAWHSQHAQAILALITPDAQTALDSVVREAEARGYRAGWQFAFGQCEATGSVPDPDYVPTRARTEGEG